MAEPGDTTKREVEANEESRYRFPAANITTNPNRERQEPQKFSPGQKVTVKDAFGGHGWVEGKVDGVKRFGYSWKYSVKDDDGKFLFDPTDPRWIAQGPLIQPRR